MQSVLCTSGDLDATWVGYGTIKTCTKRSRSHILVLSHGCENEFLEEELTR